jgi:putative transposase
MSRRLRTHVFGGTYYAVPRGGGARPLFANDDERSLFLSLLGASACTNNATLYAYCLTPFDARLLIGVSEIPLGRILQRVTAQFAREVNQRAGVHGHLFGDRYKAVLIPGNNELLAAVRHIHRTPLCIGIAASLSRYRWSSHFSYLGENREVKFTRGGSCVCFPPTKTSRDAPTPGF